MIFQNGIISNSFQMEYERIPICLFHFFSPVSLLSLVKPGLLLDAKGRKQLPSPRLLTYCFVFPEISFPPGRLSSLRYRADTDSHSEYAVLHSPPLLHNIKRKKKTSMYVKVLNLHIFIYICLFLAWYIRPSPSLCVSNINFFSCVDSNLLKHIFALGFKF